MQAKQLGGAMATALVLLTLSGSAHAKGQECKLSGSAYQLVDDPNFEFVFEGQIGLVAGIPFELRDKGSKFLGGVIVASNGWPNFSLAIDALGDHSGSKVTFLGADLKDAFEPDPDVAAAYLVIPTLTAALYYADANHEPKHFPQGSVWKLKSCGK